MKRHNMKESLEIRADMNRKYIIHAKKKNMHELETNINQKKRNMHELEIT